MLPLAAEYVISGAGAALEAAGTGAAIDGTIADALGSKAFNGVGDRIVGTALGAAKSAVANYKAVSGKPNSKRKEVMIQSTSDGDKKRTKQKLTNAGRLNSASDYNAIFSRERLLDGALVEQAGSQKLTTLNMKVGKKAYKDPVPTFLDNLTGRGSVTCEWGGILNSKDALNTRGVFFTMFRHRLTGMPTKGNLTPGPTSEDPPLDANTQSVPYDQGDAAIPPNCTYTSAELNMSDFILYPQAPNYILGANANMGQASGMYHNHALDGRTWWTPLNRADYEDMSWNLNKLKLGQSSIAENQPGFKPLEVDPPTNPPTYYWPHQDPDDPAHTQLDGGASFPDLFDDQVALFRKDAHRRQSAIQINNQWNEYNYNNALQNAPYKYDMCFNGGTIDYNFSNMESSPCKVTVVVYKVKKNANLPAVLCESNPLGDASTTGFAEQKKYWPGLFFNRDLIADPIGEAYVQNQYKEIGTDNLGGRQPEKSDIWAKPEYPFLPELKRTIQSALPYKEVMRNEFAMPSGAHRHVVINLPGDIYDPANVSTIKKDTFDWRDQNEADSTADISKADQPYPLSSQPIVDQHSYMVAIACAGMVGPRFITSQPIITQGAYEAGVGLGYNQAYGNNFGPFNLQYTCRYTEDISGCLYKNNRKKKIFVSGKGVDVKIKQPDVPTGGPKTIFETQQAIIPINHGVRLPTTSTHYMEAGGVTAAYASTMNSGTIGNGIGIAPGGN